MKAFVLGGLVLGLTTGLSHAAWYHFSWTNGFANGGVIPDGNPAGWSDVRTITIPEPQILEVKVRLQITGGFNGDLYGYLTHASGFAVLLNRPGRTGSNLFGYPDAGFHVTFSDTASEPTDFHFYQTVSGYNISGGTEWRPDGRNVDPATVTGTESRTALLSSFAGLIPSGTWTLFLADLSVGETSTVQRWDLSINAVPEPGTGSLAIFGALGIAAARWLRRASRPKTSA
ncbi:MAG: PEP-CTERM sorting domain-containing protein [Verrucomicrobiae bacterium]|nr:PEP-CTERM sorting domain-containing protein [Verrucomicrobiae bacterium]